MRVSLALESAREARSPSSAIQTDFIGRLCESESRTLPKIGQQLMSIDIFLVDAFADEPLSGNPAAVCPLSSWPPDTLMQSIAAELNQSETVFFVPEGNGYRIRWFTPTKEVDHIGHATLAAGYLILSRLTPGESEIRFLTGDDYMLVRRDGNHTSLDMAALVPHNIDMPDEIVAALGIRPAAALAAKHYLFVFDQPSEVANLKPDMTKIATFNLPGVIVTAPGGDGSDFVSRFFAPTNGVPEDSVSGVSHCCLAPYWSLLLGKSRLIGRQLSPRGGIVLCEHQGQRVILAGSAAVSLEGRLHLPTRLW